MRKIFFFICLCPGILFAQFDEPGIGLKLQSRIIGDFQTVSTLELQGLIPAIVFKNARLHSQQIEIYSFQAKGNFDNTEIDGINRGDFHMGVAYEYSIPIKAFVKNPQYELEAGCGTAIAVTSYIIHPNSSQVYRATGTSFQVGLYGVAVFRKYIGENCFLELSPQFYIGEFGFTRAKTEDPRVAIRFQSRNIYSYHGHRFKKYALRFGIGVKL